MKKIITILSIICIIQIPSFGQITNSKSFWDNNRLELSGLIELSMFKNVGFIVKEKKEIHNSRHFEGFAGLAFQYSYWSETDKLVDGIKGGGRDLGTYMVLDWPYYPLKTKNIFIGSELFIGVTNMKTSGSLKIPKYNIDDKFTNSYTYLNYGFTETIGYNFGRISTGVFTMISLKGALDEGRSRIGASDSKVFFGFSLSYKLKPLG